MTTQPTVDPTGRPRSATAASPLGSLARFGDAPALLTRDSRLTYAELVERVRERTARLGGTRRLVELECRNDVETVVSYLAALEGRHALLLTGPGSRREGLVASYRPDVLACGDRIDVQGPAGRDLHPDLALLLSTSGSTGSPKLVRISRDGLASNAESIATYLGLTGDDRAATTLPLHYCYGLSVVNSHLLVGGSLLLTEDSVVDERFWSDFTGAAATSFAGVPHTFDLLDATGFSDREVPTLRTVTQAGGRLVPETVRRYAQLGQRKGFDFVVMYGQTEATARMAYLPPHLAAGRPECIGIPIPGGSLRIDGGGEVGELVYSGENVMLGYAHGAEDLALGRTVHELRTGDLARQHDDGLFEVVGRTGRLAKLFGVRLDLDGVEDLARQDGWVVRAVEHDGRLHLFLTAFRDLSRARALGRALGLPAHAVEAHVVSQQPVTASGKPDYGALLRHAQAADEAGPAISGHHPVTPARVRDLYAHLLGRPDATEEDSFVSLGGDSLSHVEASLRLGQLLARLPPGWAQLSARDLAQLAPTKRAGRRRWAPVETSVALRAVAIVAIIGTHANLLTLLGGAHVLLAVVGFNLARFQLAESPGTERRRSLLRAAGHIFVPSALWIGAAGLLTGMYDVSTALLLNNLLGSDSWDVRWQFWFLEVVVASLLGVGLASSVPVLDRLERAHRFAAAATVLVTASAIRYALVGVEAGPVERYALPVVLWCVALGWMAARAETVTHRVLTSLAAGVSCWGFFDDPVREGLVAAAVCALTWLPVVRLPVVLLPAVRVLAASSLFVYLTHWQVYPHLEVDHPFLATLASFVVGILVWRTYAVTSATGTAVWRQVTSRRTPRDGRRQVLGG